MKNSKLLPAGFLAVAAILSGLTVATAQTATDVTPAPTKFEAGKQDAKHVNFRKGHGRRGGPGMMAQIMEKVDANGDRTVTQVEIDTFRAALVAEADVSGDGDISLAEFETIYLQMTRDRMVDAFQELDKDGNGVITQAEMDKRFGSIVERMDRNDDGKLDREDHAKGGRDGHGQRKQHDRQGKHNPDRQG